MELLEELDTIEELEDMDFAPALPRPYVRPELIMGILAGLLAILVAVLLVLCWPQLTASDDPEAPKHIPQLLTPPPEAEAAEEFVLDPTDPTIYPDANPYDRNDFQYNRQNYLLLQNVTSYAGVDVSSWQGDIDWHRVAASGIDFAFIRLGNRGYEGGKLKEDAYAHANLDGAREAGLKVGAYFFSQALTIQEVDEEVDLMLEILGDRRLDLPIVLDWEIPTADARTAKMDRRTLTDLQKHYIARMKALGLEPMVYFSPYQSQNLYYLSELEEVPFWLAHYQDRMTFPFKVEYWQYTDQGKVPGIKGNVDLNVYMPH